MPRSPVRTHSPQAENAVSISPLQSMGSQGGEGGMGEERRGEERRGHTEREKKDEREEERQKDGQASFTWMPNTTNC